MSMSIGICVCTYMYGSIFVRMGVNICAHKCMGVFVRMRMICLYVGW